MDLGSSPPSESSGGQGSGGQDEPNSVANTSSSSVSSQRAPLKSRETIQLTHQYANGDNFESDEYRRRSLESCLQTSTSSPASGLCRIFPEPLFADFSIVTSDEHTIPVHRCVLASWSSYFYALFSSRCQESLASSLRFSDLTQEELIPVLSEMYGNEVELTTDNIDQLLVISDRFGIKSLVRKFSRFKEAQMSSNNVFEIFAFALYYNLTQLIEYCKKFIGRFLIEFSEREEFKMLTDTEVEMLLGVNEIFCNSEKELLAVICRWADHDYSGRIASAYWLLYSLRYKYPGKTNFTDSFFSEFHINVRVNELVEKFKHLVTSVGRCLPLNEECSSEDLNRYEDRERRGFWNSVELEKKIDKEIAAVLKSYMKKENRSRNTLCEAAHVFTVSPEILPLKTTGLMSTDERARGWFEKVLQPRCASSLVFLFGGWSGKEPSETIQVLDPITYKWTVTTLKLPEMRIYYAAAEIDSVIYIVGGFDNNQRGLKSTWAFEPISGAWTRKSDMYESRCYASSVVYDGKIIVLGGYDDSMHLMDQFGETGGRRFRSVERYCPKQDKWEKCCEMREVRSDAAAVVCNGYIYCIGGFTGDVIHKSVEAIDGRLLAPYSQGGSSYHWGPVAEMHSPRSGVSCEVFNGCIYAVGGYDGENQLNSIERYDPRFNIWQHVARMEVPRSNMGLLAINNRLVIVGGYGNDYTTDSCELFDPASNHSKKLASLPSPEGCSGIKLVVSSRNFEVSKKYVIRDEHERLDNNKRLLDLAEARNERIRQQNNMRQAG